jgi:hypothetical protein
MAKLQRFFGKLAAYQLKEPSMPRLFDHLALRLKSIVCAATFGFLLAGVALTAQAERQSSFNLFPRDTLFYVGTSNAKELVERMKESSTGRMLQDPQIKPIIDRVLGEVGNLYTEHAETEVGVPWNELLNLPKGELALGAVAVPDAPPALLLILDQGEEPTVAGTLVERVLKVLKDEGGDTSKENIEGVEVTIVRASGGRVIGMFERDRTIVAATHPDVLRHVIWHWDGTRKAAAERAAEAGNQENPFAAGPTLDTNEKFLSILKECRRPHDPPPNMVFYADPIELFRQFGRANPGMQLAIAFLPQLGLDGIQAVGGAMTSATGPYESLAHLHILLQNPRAGILSMIAFDTGDNTPPTWVPADVSSYFTARWKAQAFYARLSAIVDQFQGEGQFEQQMNESFTEEFGINLKTDIIENLTGRVTLVSGYDKPFTLQSGRWIIGIEVVDEARAQQTLDTIVSRQSGSFTKRFIGAVPYYAPPDEADGPFSPCIAIMDKHMFFSLSTKLFEQAVMARQGEAPRLAESQDYQRISATLTEETSSHRPAVLMVSRPVVDWEFYYGMITSDEVRAALDEAAADNEVLERFVRILREGAIPPFDVFKKYLAPGGGILYDTDNGFHGTMFALRPE